MYKYSKITLNKYLKYNKDIFIFHCCQNYHKEQNCNSFYSFNKYPQSIFPCTVFSKVISAQMF